MSRTLAHRRGREDCEKRYSREDNPYHPTDRCNYSEWLKGFLERQKEMAKAKENS
jgi:hypothetical protein